MDETLKQFKSKLGFLTPTNAFIINATFAILSFLFFILQDGVYNGKLISFMFEYAGGILGFFAVVGLVVAAVAYPLKKQRLSVNLNIFIIGFLFLHSLMGVYHWGIFSILLVILALLPWLVFTLLVKGDEVKL